MECLERDFFCLEAFQGPLDFLLHLVQKNELDLSAIPLLPITEQFQERYPLSPDLDKGAEFVGMTALLLYLKSKQLLPFLEVEGESTPIDDDPQFAIIHHLLDYCRYKRAAEELISRESEQSLHHMKGQKELPKKEKGLGIEHLSLEDLSAAFQKVLQANREKGSIAREEWSVSDKIGSIRKMLICDTPFPFTTLFSPEKPRMELIVTFLAVLELMKLHELQAIQDKQGTLYFCKGEEEDATNP